MSVIVKLVHPFELHGALVGELELRDATVADVRRVGKQATSATEQELSLSAALIGCEVSDLERMNFADYRKIQAALKSLLGEDESD